MVGQDQEDCFLSGIRPIVALCKCLGVDLTIRVNRTRNCLSFSTLYGFVVLVLHAIIQLACLNFTFKNVDTVSSAYIPQNSFNSAAYKWNVVIDCSNYAVHAIAAHLILVFIVRRRWLDLLTSFQHLRIFGTSVRNKLRKVSYTAVLYVLAVLYLLCNWKLNLLSYINLMLYFLLEYLYFYHRSLSRM